MAENKGAEKKEKKSDDGAERETPQERHMREKKLSRWTLEACMKIAKRFDSRAEWQNGHPSSFKSAISHGWDAKCSAHMKGIPVKSTAKKTPEKVAAKKKSPAKLPRSA